jgi:hypothetical protein
METAGLEYTGNKITEHKILNITSGDISGRALEKSGIPGEVFVWRDILYDGPREPGWPSEEILKKRAVFLEETTGGGLSRDFILKTLEDQYEKLESADKYENIILWFDACLFDQSMLVHILNCLRIRRVRDVELLCVDSFPGIEPYNGLGQLTPEQMASVYNKRVPVSAEEFLYARHADEAFVFQKKNMFNALAELPDPLIPWIPAAVKRWLQERPNKTTGLGRLEQMALDAVRSGCETPLDIFTSVAGSPAVGRDGRFEGVPGFSRLTFIIANI